MDKTKVLVECGECTKPIRIASNKTSCIKCTRCLHTFHLLCVNITDKKNLDDSIWICPLCRCKEPKKDNTNTPVRSITTQLTSLTSPPPAASEITTLIEDIKLLRSDIGEIKSQMTSLSDLVKHCVKRLDDQETKFIELNSRLCKVEERQKDVILNRSKISELRLELESRAQASLRKEVEIHGINEFPGESPMHVIQIISNKLGISLDTNDLDYVTRVGPRRSAAQLDGNDKLPTRSQRPLVARFLRRHTCEGFLAAAKSRRNLTSSDIGVGDIPTTIYVNERLTQGTRHLFRSARRFAKSAEYKFCWIKGGSIYLRKREGNPAIRIKSMDDLESMHGFSVSCDPAQFQE